MKQLPLFIFLMIFLNTIIITPSSHLSPTKAFIQRQNANLLIIAQQENANLSFSKNLMSQTWPLTSTKKTKSSKEKLNITQSDDKKIKKFIALYNLNEKIRKINNENNHSVLKPNQSDTEPQVSPSYLKKLAKKSLQGQ